MAQPVEASSLGCSQPSGPLPLSSFSLLCYTVLRYTRRGKILLDRIGRPGEFDDEQAYANEEADALEQMDDLQRIEYLRAKC